jgi:hypothetical protein
MTPAVITVLRSRSGLGARPVTGTAGLVPDKTDGAGHALSSLGKRQGQLAEDILALPGPRPPSATTATKCLSENTAAKQLSKGIKDIRDVIEVVRAALQTGMPVAVVAVAERCVREHLECSGGLLEPASRLFVTRVAVWVELHREFAIGRGDLTRRSPSLNAKHFVVIPLLRHDIRSLPTPWGRAPLQEMGRAPFRCLDSYRLPVQRRRPADRLGSASPDSRLRSQINEHYPRFVAS